MTTTELQASKETVSCIFGIYDRLSIAICSINQAKKLMLMSLKTNKFVSPDTMQIRSARFRPSSIIDMYTFCHSLKEVLLSNAGKNAIVCAGQSQDQITNTALLLGSFLILHQGLSLHQVQQAFLPIQDRFLHYRERSCVGQCTELLTVLDCWTALSVARTLDWIDFGSGQGVDDASPLLDMEEFAHYDSPVNGNFHLAVPPKFVVFHCPVDLPPARRWMDADGVRHFSPAYYADLFAFLGVTLVVRAAPCDYDACPFAARGIAVEDLAAAAPPAACSAGSLLRTADRLLTLAGATDGLIAIHGGASGAGRALGPAAAALASYLVSQHGFPAKAAVAWLRIAAPRQDLSAALPAEIDADSCDGAPSFVQGLEAEMGAGRNKSCETCSETSGRSDTDPDAKQSGPCRRPPSLGDASPPGGCGIAGRGGGSGGRRRASASAPSSPTGPTRTSRPMAEGPAVRARSILWH
jgi:hypothetical protein